MGKTNKPVTVVFVCLLALLGLLSLSGCVLSVVEEPVEVEVTERVEVVDAGKLKGHSGYSVLKDTETGVCYLWVGAGYKGGLSTMYNADGSIYTMEVDKS